MRRSVPRFAVIAALPALLVLVLAPSAAHALGFDRTAYPTGLSPWHAAAGDFNGDSDPDLAVANLDSEHVSILVGGPGATFTGPTNIAAGPRPIGVAVGDFNGDLDPDLAVANNTEHTVSILLGGPGATFSDPAPFTTGGGSENVAVGDFNGDSDPDLAVPNRNVDKVSVLLGETEGTFSFRVNYDIGPDPLGVAVADFNGDLDPDVAVTNHAAPPNVSILEGQAAGAFGNPSQVSAGQKPVGIAVGEFNGDSDPDLAVTNYLGASVSVLLGTAGSGFAAPADHVTAAGSHAVAIGDLNGDSDPDLAVANAVGANVSILLGAAGSTFVDHGDVPVGPGARSVLISDFDQDARPDMAFASDDGLVTLVAVDSPGYARPRGASPMRASLVPAYLACAAPNGTHGPPLGFGSCSPPQQESGELTVGTPDAAAGGAANSVGFVRVNTLVGSPSTPADEADFRIVTSVTDVRRRADHEDYTGEVQVALTVRRTDRAGSGTGDEAQTTQDFPFRVTVPCAVTGATTIGATCALTTSADAVTPGAVPEGKRSIWALDRVRVNDGGPDGDADTLGDNTLFATQGIFIP